MHRKQNNDFIQQILLFYVGLQRVFMRVPRHMCVMLLMQKPPFWHRSQMHCDLFTSRGMQTHVSWYSRQHASKSDTEEKKLLNIVVFFLFFYLFKKYSRSVIILQLNHWCHMDYLNEVRTTFLGLEHGSSLAVYAGSESSWLLDFIKNILICVSKMNECLIDLERHEGE